MQSMKNMAATPFFYIYNDTKEKMQVSLKNFSTELYFLKIAV